jgi:glycosyltransferase 2 family protein
VPSIVSDLLKRWRNVLYYVGLGAGLAVFLYQVWHGIQGLRQPDTGIAQIMAVVAATGVIVFAYLLQMLAWTVILRGLGHAIKLRAVLSGYVLSFLPRYIPGSIWGYLGRGEWLKVSCGIPYATSGLSSLLEVGVGLLTAVVIAGSAYAWTTWHAPALWLVIPATALAPWLSWLAYDVLRRQPLTRRLDRLNLLASAETGIGFGYWLLAYVIYCVFWLCYGAALSLLLQGITGRSAGLLQPTFAYSLAWTVGFLILIVPSGLGAREAMLSTLLSWQLQMSAQSAGAVAIAARIVVLLAEMAWLVVGVVLSRTRSRRVGR